MLKKTLYFARLYKNEWRGNNCKKNGSVVAKMPNLVPQIFQMCFRLFTKAFST